MINIKTDSRNIEKGDIFVAIKGLNNDGHNFISDAIKKGASKVVVSKDIPNNIPKIVVDDTKKWLINELKNKYSEEINKMNLIAVTGTNGKTTTSYLTYQILNLLNSKTAYIGTIGYYLNDEKLELSNTTPDILNLYELLLLSKKNKVDNVVMELSSQGLEQNRIEGLKLKVGLFTNLTQDHLDYHKTMKNYLNSKLKMLNYLSGIMIVNSDDEYSKYFKKTNNKILDYGFNAGDIKIISYEDLKDGTLINFSYSGNIYKVKTNLYGEFNVYNYISAVSIVHSLGYDIEKIINITNRLYPPKGRCEIVNFKNNKIVVDYAHTPDAVLKIIKTFKNKKGKIITIIGCGGNRDKIKRPIMGKITTNNSDFVIFTNDNPRFEDANTIINDIIKDLKNTNYIIVKDRKQAIIKGIDMLKENDILLVLGKGHENYQIIENYKYHFDDLEQIKKYLNI